MIKEISSQEELLRASQMGEAFWNESFIPGRFVPSVFIASWTRFTEGNVGKIFGMFGDDGEPKGYLGMLFTPDINDGEPIATEAFWFVLPEHRGSGLKLYFHAMKTAKELGCKRVTMAHLKNFSAPTLAKFYERQGFTEVETFYVKNLATE